MPDSPHPQTGDPAPGTERHQEVLPRFLGTKGGDNAAL